MQVESREAFLAWAGLVEGHVGNGEVEGAIGDAGALKTEAGHEARGI